MNLSSHNVTAHALRPSSRTQRAFTMIEIALAIGVIGFALVAIIGLLPAGLNVQKNNREDTIVSQDAPYFINAIRNGEQRVNHNILTNFVETITLVAITNGSITTNVYQNPNLVSSPSDLTLVTDSNIIGLLSTPEYDHQIPNLTNEVTAIVRAMTGSATEQSGSNGAVAFRYALTVEVIPWSTYGFGMTNYLGTTDPVESNYLYSRFEEAQASVYLTNNMREVRLKFSWPVLPNNTVGPNHQTYRTVVSGHLNKIDQGGPLYWFFQPNVYAND